MMVDRYTKMVLTVIAGCLLWICATTFAGPAHAQSQATSLPGGAQPVVVVGYGSVDQDGKISVRTISTSRTAFHTDPVVSVRAEQALPVKLPYTPQDPLPTHVMTNAANPLAVTVTAVQRSGPSWDPIRTQVEPEGARARPGGEDR
jgi:hypothetical protein